MMSDLSSRWCKQCRSPEYVCECDDERNMIEAPINFLMRNENIPDNHPIKTVRGKNDNSNG